MSALHVPAATAYQIVHQSVLHRPSNFPLHVTLLFACNKSFMLTGLCQIHLLVQICSAPTNPSHGAQSASVVMCCQT
eukprot:c15078_g1_i2 orf=18-248(-)